MSDADTSEDTSPGVPEALDHIAQRIADANKVAAELSSATAIALLVQIRDRLASLDDRIGAVMQLLLGGGGGATATATTSAPATVTATPAPIAPAPDDAPAQAAAPEEEDEDARLPRGTPLSAYRVAPPASALNFAALADLDAAVKAAAPPPAPQA